MNTDYRDEYRRQHVPAGYHGWRHLTFAFGTGGAAMVLSALQATDVTPLEWVTIPLTFLYADFAEHWGHRGPMHHLTRGLRLVCERHTRQHRRFFTSDNMELDGLRDLRAVLFPPLLMSFFVTAFMLPAALLLACTARTTTRG